MNLMILFLEMSTQRKLQYTLFYLVFWEIIPIMTFWRKLVISFSFFIRNLSCYFLYLFYYIFYTYKEFIVTASIQVVVLFI